MTYTFCNLWKRINVIEVTIYTPSSHPKGLVYDSPKQSIPASGKGSHPYNHNLATLTLHPEVDSKKVTVSECTFQFDRAHQTVDRISIVISTIYRFLSKHPKFFARVIGVLKGLGLMKTIKAAYSRERSVDLQSSFLLFGWAKVPSIKVWSRDKAKYEHRRSKPNWELPEFTDTAGTNTVDVLVSVNDAALFFESHLSCLEDMEANTNINFIYFLNQECKFLQQAIADLGRTDTKIISSENHRTLYEAWNLMIRASSSNWITNWNIDDVRAPWSFSHQLWLAENLGGDFDIFFSDFYLTYEPNLAWEELIEFSPKAELQHLSQFSITRGATPHAAPLWKRSLHVISGYFDESYCIASDRDFWLRALTDGARPFYDPVPHYAYYLNPEGLSTRSSSGAALDEQMRLQHKFDSAIQPDTKTSLLNLYATYAKDLNDA